MKILTLFLGALPLTACGNDDSLHNIIIEYDQSFTPGIGQTAITSDSVRVTLMNVPTDSHCALNATCIWEGEIVAELEGAHGGVMIPMEIRQSPRQIEPAAASFIRFSRYKLQGQIYQTIILNLQQSLQK